MELLGDSAIYHGQIRHRRFTPAKHGFTYHLYMLALDLADVESGGINQGLLGQYWYKPIRFVEKDYLKSEPGDLRARITNKVNSLGGIWQGGKVVMLVQARCFGLYFSPANFFFCYDEHDNCRYMLVEVSNTPWNKRHYYLVDLTKVEATEKVFHVSPFFDLAMQYHWRVNPPTKKDKNLLVHIENIKEQEKLFDATLALKRVPMTSKHLSRVWLTLPHMTLKIVAGIYYQALKLFIKKVPFVPYQTKNSGH
ncbi:DUF1365 domain-containing protein [Thalassotalea sp. LPB0316]|uniref:DUF1365 domain-containing protein n=1 Tax=Thalassotalea sp. LPB0316 TaxID=2769490 RepID=UPI001868B27E|nr:DUF1365 domain-containing protein [Thalassotalea sp. LPB0316]QOL27021.1 DUF1365 domain-containing protein [Thalassotalea sp. LPB0316]